MRMLVTLVMAGCPSVALAQAAQPKQDAVEAAIERGLGFLVKDALAWKATHKCVSCQHAALVIWSMREARQRGHAVDDPVLAELTKWVAESGDGKTSVPRPKGLPKALNAKAVWFALVLAADPKPDAAVHKSLTALWNTVKSDQAEKGNWVSWPETRPPIFGNSDDSMTALATLALLPAVATGLDGAKAARDKGVRWLTETRTDDDPQSIAMRLVLWKRLGRPAKEWEPLARRIKERQNADGGWSQAKNMASDAWASGQALYALAHAGSSARDPAVARGQAFLVKTQRANGSWPMTSRPTKPGDTGSPGLIPITGAGSAWGVLGLVRSR
ncbi:MAG: terpene cyclase/mutase family protein [Planctomycetes bacterium]|nr:terpene cyclase/mutase family protein [Planctomycetota bacterium]